MIGRRLKVAGGRPVDIVWTDAATNYPTGMKYGTLVRLLDGRVCHVGGSTSFVNSGVTAIVRFGTLSGSDCSWATGTSLPAVRANSAVVVLPDGRLLVMGGGNGGGTAQSTVYFGTITGNTIAWVTGTAMPATHKFIKASVLADGRVVVVGNGSATVRFATITGNTIAWATGTAMNQSYATDNQPVMYVRNDGVTVVACGLTASGNRTKIGVITGDVIAWTNGTDNACASTPFATITRKDSIWFPDSWGDGDTWQAAGLFGDLSRFFSSGVQLFDGRMMTVGGTDFSTVSNAVRFSPA